MLRVVFCYHFSWKLSIFQNELPEEWELEMLILAFLQLIILSMHFFAF